MSKRKLESKTAQKVILKTTPVKKGYLEITPITHRISTRKKEWQGTEDIRQLIERVITRQDELQASIELVQDMLSRDQQEGCSIGKRVQELTLKE